MHAHFINWMDFLCMIRKYMFFVICLCPRGFHFFLKELNLNFTFLYVKGWYILWCDVVIYFQNCVCGGFKHLISLFDCLVFGKNIGLNSFLSQVSHLWCFWRIFRCSWRGRSCEYVIIPCRHMMTCDNNFFLLFIPLPKIWCRVSYLFILVY